MAERRRSTVRINTMQQTVSTTSSPDAPNSEAAQNATCRHDTLRSLQSSDARFHITTS